MRIMTALVLSFCIVPVIAREREPDEERSLLHNQCVPSVFYSNGILNDASIRREESR